ncbi:Uncharacterised protein [Vibrio cholerae]|nr:Uncharacterised protein [Vibrio cholerae]CSD01283.1 Uncharacterised protein [Vibrio cholerae]
MPRYPNVAEKRISFNLPLFRNHIGWVYKLRLQISQWNKINLHMFFVCQGQSKCALPNGSKLFEVSLI